MMPPGFDSGALYRALDTRRQENGLSWTALAAVLWRQSQKLNELRQDHPIAATTLRKFGEGRGPSCQHALFALRWLGLPPEAFVVKVDPRTLGVPLPVADDGQRLRWNLKKLYAVLDAARKARGATWEQAAERLDCTAKQLTGLRTAKFAAGMVLAMRITQALHRPAANFVYAADW